MSGDSGCGGNWSAVIALSSVAAAAMRGFARLLVPALLLRLAMMILSVVRRGINDTISGASGADDAECCGSGCARCAGNIAAESPRGNMNVQDIPLSGNDHAGVALIDAATLLLAKRKSAIPEDFLAKLFALAMPEDLARYTADELAGID